jgi:hypothetical protein
MIPPLELNLDWRFSYPIESSTSYPLGGTELRRLVSGGRALFSRDGRGRVASPLLRGENCWYGVSFGTAWFLVRSGVGFLAKILEGRS